MAAVAAAAAALLLGALAPTRAHVALRYPPARLQNGAPFAAAVLRRQAHPELASRGVRSSTATVQLIPRGTRFAILVRMTATHSLIARCSRVPHIDARAKLLQQRTQVRQQPARGVVPLVRKDE